MSCIKWIFLILKYTPRFWQKFGKLEVWNVYQYEKSTQKMVKNVKNWTFVWQLTENRGQKVKKMVPLREKMSKSWHCQKLSKNVKKLSKIDQKNDQKTWFLNFSKGVAQGSHISPKIAGFFPVLKWVIKPGQPPKIDHFWGVPGKKWQKMTKNDKKWQKMTKS